MRQGAAVPGTWKDDPTGFGTYGDDVTTKQADKDKLAAAFDPRPVRPLPMRRTAI